MELSIKKATFISTQECPVFVSMECRGKSYNNIMINESIMIICMLRYITRTNGGATFPSRGVFCQQIRDQINGSS